MRSAEGTPRHCTGPRPRIWLYPSPLPPFQDANNWRFGYLPDLIRQSAHYASDGECADFFLISHMGGRASSNLTFEMFHTLAQRWPYWNRTLSTAGSPRHLLMLPGDHGAGDSMFSRLRDGPYSCATPSGLVPPELNPGCAATRRVAFVQYNGDPNGHTRFAKGLDIRIPQDHLHICGPFCGMGGRWKHAPLGALRNLSLWSLQMAAPNRADHAEARRAHSKEAIDTVGRHAHVSAALETELRRRRPHLVFWAGFASAGVRKMLMRAHLNRSGFVLRDTITGDASKEYSPDEEYWFPRMMTESTFCLSPLGQHMGDSDRYLPAMLYGCIPVFMQPDEAGPFDDLLPWANMSINLAGDYQVPKLHQVLGGIPHERIVEMRRVIGRHWPALLWSRWAHQQFRADEPRTAHATTGNGIRHEIAGEGVAGHVHGYLGESGHDDAFASFLAVLRHRLKHVGEPLAAQKRKTAQPAR